MSVKAYKVLHCELKPFAKRLVEALDNGTAVYKQTAGKYCYVYELRND